MRLEELRNRLPGYAVPRLAREHPEAPARHGWPKDGLKHVILMKKALNRGF